MTDELVYCENFNTCSHYGSPACGFCPCKPDNTRARGPVSAQQQAPSDDVISGLISENACVGAELKHANETISRLNGEHDAAIAAQARKEVMNEFGILHGEDAKRLYEYLNSKDPIDTPEGRKLVAEANAQYQKERTALQDRDRLMQERGAAAERARVLKDVIGKLEIKRDAKKGLYLYEQAIGIEESITTLEESLRSQPEKQSECGACTGPDPLDAAYKRFKHMEQCFQNVDDGSDFSMKIARDLFFAIKEYRQQQGRS